MIGSSVIICYVRVRETVQTAATQAQNTANSAASYANTAAQYAGAIGNLLSVFGK